jgi:CheY-like chemotaxis protein
MDETRRCRILAVSSYDWKSSIRNRLDLSGYSNDELRTASSGLQAIADAEKDPPDLIIYSLSTLDLDAYEFCRKLHWTPALQDVPVLLVGWLSPTIVYPEARLAGASGYLYSAVHSQNLITARNALLRGDTYYPSLPFELASMDASNGEQGCTVLVIDDNPAMGELVQMMLGRARNDDVRYANSGPKGLETVPVLFHTAYARAYEMARSVGASGCLIAPYSEEELVAARDAALRGEVYEPEPKGQES